MAGNHPIHPLSLTSSLATNGQTEIMYPCKKLSFLRKHFPGTRLLSQGLMTYNYSKTYVEYKMVDNNVRYTKGGDNSNKRCFGTKPKLFRESGDFSGNRDTWKFFRETRDNSGTLQKKIGTSKEILFYVSQKFERMIQISRPT